MALNTSNANPTVRNRILNYINHAPSAATLAGTEPMHGPVLDDPALGSSLHGYDLGLTVAERILDRRDAQPGHQLTDVDQLDGIDGFGQDKFDDLVYTFGRYWELYFAVSLFAQITGYYCGAATAQMILDFVNNWAGAPLINQDDLYDIIQNHKTDHSFYTDPDGLAGCLNQESPAGIGWVIHSGTDQEQANRRLAVNMEHYDNPAAALIYDGDHWVVVSGVTATEAPSMSADSFIIYTFRIHDPAGGGSIRDIDYYTWCSSYLTPNTWGTTWDNQYVVVVDPRITSDKKAKFAMPNFKTDGQDLVTPEQAKKYAIEALDDYMLSSRDEYQAALVGAEPGTPILVKNLSETDKPHYYLVPFENDQKTTLVVRINAYYGNYLESKLTNRPKGYLRVAEQEAKTLLTDHVKDLNHADIKSAQLVWKPSEQTWDPFNPVWEVKAHDKANFITQSRDVVSKLTAPKKGGM